MERIQNIYKVISNENLCERFRCLRIDAKEIQQEVQPGQFIHIKANDGLEPFFRRPFSVYRAKDCIEMFYEVVGPGTQILSEKSSGDEVDIVGPVGQSFTLPSENIKQVVMIAGGIGVAPFLMLSDVLKSQNVEMILLYGGRTEGHTYPMTEFKENGVKVFVSTDDGSVGVHGRVSELFDKINCDSETTMVYTCGPHPLMKAVQNFAKQHHLRGQAACEEVMACALGACLGCAVQTTEGYKTVCHDGPVFDLQSVIF